MPSSYSTNLALELMLTGEDNNTWGDKTNNNLGTLIEQSIVATGAVAIADVNTTITMLNATTCAARCLVLNVTGALTAQRNLVVPTIQKPYIVANNTTGGFGVQVKTAAGTGIVVPSGAKMLLYADGTNVVGGLNSLLSLILSGATSGTTTVQASAVASGTLTLPAATDTLMGKATTDTLTNKTYDTAGAGNALAINGVAATDNTGTGKVVRDTSPTITGATVNKVTLTAPATAATITIADGKTLTVDKTLEFDGTDSTVMTFPSTSGTVVTRDSTDTLTNKTLTNAIVGTQTAGDNSTKAASTAYADNTLIQIVRTVSTGNGTFTGTYSTTTGAAPTVAGGVDINVLATSFTPKSATSVLEMNIVVKGTPNTAADAVILALFNGGTLVDYVFFVASAGAANAHVINLNTWLASPGTSAQSFTVRIGTNSGFGWGFNDTNNGASFTPALGISSWFVIKEIQPHA